MSATDGREYAYKLARERRESAERSVAQGPFRVDLRQIYGINKPILKSTLFAALASPTLALPSLATFASHGLAFAPTGCELV